MTVSTYFKTYLALLALATLSLLLKGLPARLAVSVSLVIAAIKAATVLLFFMGLIKERFSSRFVMLVSSLLVGVLVVLTALDPMTRPSQNSSYVHRAR